MGSIQLRLFITYLVIISVTLGLTALSLFLLLGGYRDDITYGNLEDVGRLTDSTANDAIRSAVALPQSTIPRSEDLLFTLRQFLEKRDANEIPGETSVAIVTRGGEVIPGLWRAPSSTELEGSAITWRSSNERVEVNPVADANRTPRQCELQPRSGPRLLCVAMPLSEQVLLTFPGTDAAALVVAKPAAGLGEVFGDLMPRLLFSGLIGVAAALILGFAFSQSVTAPLRNIARAARSVARGNYRQRVPATGPREVRDLAANFNRMTEEVQRSQQTLRDFLANISHELKTPLTSIRGFSSAILDGTIDDSAGIERSARIISDESNRVLRLVEELLDLSRIESGQISMRQEDLPIDELFEHVGEVFALRSEDTGVRLNLPAATRAHIRGDFDRLEQVLNNLLDNAFRHTPRDGAIRVGTFEPRVGLIQVNVTDTGAGIPPDHIPHLFERFYRAPASGTTRVKGYGLGLAICREIVRSHGGDIWATSDPGHGTTFSFTLPTAGRTAKKASARSG
jgi:signal transduction histidine kinase